MALINAIAFCNNAMGFIALSDFVNVLRGKTTVPMVKPVVMPSFVCGVGIVFGFSAYLQMFRIYASRGVAFVHNYFANRYFPHKPLIRKSMGANTFAVNQHNAVTIAIFCALPKPTIIRFNNFGIKRFINRNPGMMKQFFVAPCFAVMGAAQMTRYGWFSAFGTRDYFVGLVSQWHLLSKRQFMPYSREMQF